MKQLEKIIAITLCVFIFTACNGKAVNIKQSQPQHNKSSAATNEDNSVFDENSLLQEEPPPLVLAKQGNPDTVAWLTILGTDIDHPVMQTSNNEDYLKKNENGKYDIWGSYFADYYSKLTSGSNLNQNTVIYGHSESSENPNDKRFTQLFHYLDIDFLQENPNIYLTLDDETLVFEVFAVFFTDTDFYYIDPNPSDQGFEDFKQTIAEKNEFIFDSNFSEQDKLLTLSTCAYRYDTEKTGSHRLVVMAKLMPEGKVREKISATNNPHSKRP